MIVDMLGVLDGSFKPVLRSGQTQGFIGDVVEQGWRQVGDMDVGQMGNNQIGIWEQG